MSHQNVLNWLLDLGPKTENLLLCKVKHCSHSSVGTSPIPHACSTCKILCAKVSNNNTTHFYNLSDLNYCTSFPSVGKFKLDQAM